MMYLKQQTSFGFFYPPLGHSCRPNRSHTSMAHPSRTIPNDFAALDVSLNNGP